MLDERTTWKSQLVLVLFFGAVSIYGNIIDINMRGAIISVRDLGPLVGALACGPVVGVSAGLIGAAFRYSEGGFTALNLACIGLQADSAGDGLV